MSIYHCSIKMVGRTGGKSAVAASAYRSGEKLYDEETGLTGAFAIEPGFMTGKYLINLDSEDEGEIFMGTADRMYTELRNGKFRERGNDRGLGTSR